MLNMADAWLVKATVNISGQEGELLFVEAAPSKADAMARVKRGLDALVRAEVKFSVDDAEHIQGMVQKLLGSMMGGGHL